MMNQKHYDPSWKQKMEQCCFQDWEIQLLRKGATSTEELIDIMYLKIRYNTIKWIDDMCRIKNLKQPIIRIND